MLLWVWMFQVAPKDPPLPKEHFRGALSLGVSSKEVSEWGKK